LRLGLNVQYVDHKLVSCNETSCYIFILKQTLSTAQDFSLFRTYHRLCSVSWRSRKYHIIQPALRYDCSEHD